MTVEPMEITVLLKEGLTAIFHSVEDVLIFAASTSYQFFALAWSQINEGRLPTNNDLQFYRAKFEQLPGILSRTMCSTGASLATELARKMEEES